MEKIVHLSFGGEGGGEDRRFAVQVYRLRSYNRFQLTWNTGGKRCKRKSKSYYRLTSLIV